MMDHPRWTKQTLAEVSVSVIAGVVLVVFLGVILVQSPWAAWPPLLTTTVVGLHLIPILALAVATYYAAAHLQPRG